MNSIEVIKDNQLPAALKECNERGLALGEWPAEVKPVTGEVFDTAKKPE